MSDEAEFKRLLRTVKVSPSYRDDYLRGLVTEDQLRELALEDVCENVHILVGGDGMCMCMCGAYSSTVDDDSASVGFSCATILALISPEFKQARKRVFEHYEAEARRKQEPL